MLASKSLGRGKANDAELDSLAEMKHVGREEQSGPLKPPNDDQRSISSVSNSDDEEKKEIVKKHFTAQVQEIIGNDSFIWNPQVKVVSNFGHQVRSNLKRKAD